MTTQKHTGSLAERVLGRIDEDHLSPRPRWEFVAKNALFWTLGAAAVALGAFAFAAGLFRVENAGWRYAAATHGDFLSFSLAVAPFIWIGALALFMLIGYLNVRHTKRGYRYPLAVIALGAVLSSVALGSTLYAAGLGGDIEEALGDHPPFYRPVMVVQKSWWSAPERGLLGGEILSVATGTESFVLKDFSGNEWRVDARELRGAGLVEEGRVVRIVGVAATSTELHGCFAFPWGGENKRTAKEGKNERAQSALGHDGERGARSESGEISSDDERTNLCKGIRPYKQLRSLSEDGE